MLKKPIELAVFDFNGTLLDDFTVGCESMEHSFKTFNVQPPSRRQFRRELGASYLDLFRKFGVPAWVTHDHLCAIREMWYLSRMKQLHFRTGVSVMLGRLKTEGFRLAICSSEIGTILHSLIDRDGLRHFFEEGLVRAEARPKHATLQDIVSVAGVNPSRAVYVDDTSSGIQEAKSVGMQTVGLAHPTAYHEASRIYAADPTVSVRSIAKLETVLISKTVNGAIT